MNRYLLLSLVILVVGCSDSVSDEPDPVQYPLTVGTWEITSAVNADWYGSLAVTESAGVAKQRSDMVWIDRPDGQSMRIFLERPHTDFDTPPPILEYIEEDVSFNEENDHYYFFEFSDDTFTGWSQSAHGKVVDFDDPAARIELPYDCLNRPVPPDHSTVTIHTVEKHFGRVGRPDQLDTLSTVVIEADGIIDVVEHLNCHHSDRVLNVSRD